MGLERKAADFDKNHTLMPQKSAIARAKKSPLPFWFVTEMRAARKKAFICGREAD